MSLVAIGLFSFLAAASLVMTVFLFASAAQNSPHARLRKRLAAISRHPDASQTEVEGLLKSSQYSDIVWINAVLPRLELLRHLDLLLERANVDLKVGMFFLLACISSGLLFFLATLFNLPAILAFLIGLAAFVLPYLYISYRARKRMRLFLEQMPDGLDMMTQCLRAGLGLSQAMAMVAKEIHDPLGTEFAVFTQELNLGLPLKDALKRLQERVPLSEVRLFDTALLVHREVGGSLAELLTKLADTIRDRFRIERDIRSLTAMNRMTAWIAALMPPVLVVFMFAMDPELMREVVNTPVGRTLFLIAFLSETGGILVFRRLLRLHI